MKVFSGWYNHRQSDKTSINWVGYAISRHINWCRLCCIDYNLVASPMLKWSTLCHKPGAWAFGTLIKYEAMRIFADDAKFGDVFFWMDLDVYPKMEASVVDFLNIGSTVFSITPFSHQNISKMDTYQYSKMIWSDVQSRGSFNFLNTGIFTMSRQHVESFLNWLNKDRSIDTIEWWDDYLKKKIATYNAIEQYLSGNESSEQYSIDWVGTDEMMMEEWLNGSNIKFDTYSPSLIVAPGDDSKDAKYVHYYGANKKDYPVF